MLANDRIIAEMHGAFDVGEVAPRDAITPIDAGFRLQETETFIVEVRKMLFNWRLVVRRPETPWAFEHGFCFFGTDLETLTRAVAAGLKWEDPLNTAPAGFDKQAY